MIRDIIAKRYARAYFALAQDEGRLGEARDEFRLFTDFLSRQEELKSVLYNPVFEADKRKAVLNALLDKFEVSRSFRSLLLILIDKNKIAYVGLVAENFVQLVDAAEGRLKIDIRSAAILSKSARKALEKEFHRLTGKDVELEIAVDESLIGGLVARYGGKVYDGSIRTQLDRLGEALKA